MTPTTDKELLELAARAAGYEIARWNRDDTGHEIAWAYIDGEGCWWQPLHVVAATDCMGDALRLAVKLHMHIQIDDDDEAVYAVYAWTACSEAFEPADPTVPDIDAATRRAIVRAAASMAVSRGERT